MTQPLHRPVTGIGHGAWLAVASGTAADGESDGVVMAFSGRAPRISQADVF